MGDWQQLLQSILIGLLFSYLLAKLISVLVSFKDDNLSISRDVPPPAIPDSSPLESSQDSLIEQHDKGSNASDTEIPENDSDDWEGVESTDLDEAFSSASAFVATIAADRTKIPAGKQLQLYGFYKIATEGPCSTPQPSPLKLTARSKWQAWQKLGTMPPEEAMENYINIVAELFPSWDSGLRSDNNERNTDHKGTMGPVFSSMVYDDDDSENQTTMGAIHGYAREGEQESLQRCIDSGVSVDVKDSEGRTPLHWAVDRGHINVVQYLLQQNANINSLDNEGQTPLHYAAICEREDIAKLLANHGADPNAKDNDGMTPKCFRFLPHCNLIVKRLNTTKILCLRAVKGKPKNMKIPNQNLSYSNLAVNKKRRFLNSGEVPGSSPEPVNGNAFLSVLKLMRSLGSRLEFVVLPSFHEGVNVTVNWRLEWNATHFPFGKGLSFYVSQLYHGKLVIRNLGIFKDSFRRIDVLRLELLRMRSVMLGNSESGKKLIGTIILLMIIAVFLKPGIY